jgi:hypothetical protein
MFYSLDEVLQKPNKSLLNSTIEDVGLLYAEADYDEVV